MRQTDDSMQLSATDLANHLACQHLSQLDLAAARGLRLPPDYYEPDVAVLRQRGEEHEEAFLSHLEARGLRVARPGEGPDETTGFERTLAAMREGVDVIVQAALRDGRWFGRADVLQRVERPSRFGSWSYEVWDTKLARETQARSVLQICLYSDLLEAAQGTRPEHMYVVPPRDGFEPDIYRVDEYLAYYRLVRRRLEEAVVSRPDGSGGHDEEGEAGLGAAAAANPAPAHLAHPAMPAHPAPGNPAPTHPALPTHRATPSYPAEPAHPATAHPAPARAALPSHSTIPAHLAVTTHPTLPTKPAARPLWRVDPAPPTYPEPVAHCDICRWWPVCDAERRRDDHLSLVAGISRLQTRELRARDVRTLAALAAEPLPLSWKPSRGAVESYARVREQARVQREGREAGRVLYELLPRQPGFGLERLPAPSPGDFFFDLEGDPFVGPSGREYLFGWVVEERPGRAEYRRVWALDPAAERSAFEEFVDVVMARWKEHPDLHIYHFAPYEPSAIKRLMGRYATRGNEVDRMLRAGLFVDLHAVVRQALRASVEEYSIKKLEALYGFTRAADLKDAGVNLRIVQRALELEVPEAVEPDVRRVVETYNRDDCLSALALYRWLEGVRAELEAKGESLGRPPIGEGQPSAPVEEEDRAVKEVMEGLLAGVPAERGERSEEQQARWLLAYMLEWHRREGKAAWWEYFRLRELSDEALLDEKAAISGLQFVGPGEIVKGKATVRYRFPSQETSIRRGHKLELPLPLKGRFGTVASMDLGARTLDVKKTGGAFHVHPTSVFAHEHYPAPEQADSLLRLARWVVENGVDAPGAHRAARDLLLRRPPRVGGRDGEPLRRDGEDGGGAARRLVAALEHGTLAIQGPPGTGKTFTGARMICDLVKAGKKVGVCAMSHKVIRNILDEVVRASKKEHVSPRVFHKARDEEDEESTGEVAVITDNAVALRHLQSGTARVIGGTAWLWSREEFQDSVDVLFVDEAGQMSLANVLAIAQSAGAVVLLGDPRQLDQPLQGTHPEGTDLSALEHLLQGRKTIEDHRGLFLEETWRLHPSICLLTSELFYDGRLSARAGLEEQAILGPVPIAGAGLWFLPVAHDGNQSSSHEEIAAVAALVARLTAGDVSWRNCEREKKPLRLEDILIIAPYNAQVADLSVRLPEGARIGTVDRFQGQEAPVVVYSMTTSTPDDAPRGMEFLYSLNRFNVATSRARCACVVVGSPRLFEPECRTPRQMQLANAGCRYLELARELSLEDLGRNGGGA